MAKKSTSLEDLRARVGSRFAKSEGRIRARSVETSLRAYAGKTAKPSAPRATK